MLDTQHPLSAIPADPPVGRPSGAPRSRRAVGAVWVGLVALLAATSTAGAQEPSGWGFEDDDFADLWFHGLDVVGFHGFGPLPLYDPGYAHEARRAGDSARPGDSRLLDSRAELIAAFEADGAFEILHFVPLYFRGATRFAALDALLAVASHPTGMPKAGAETRFGVSVVAAALPEAAQRRVLGAFVAALEGEWTRVVAPRRTREAAARERLLRELDARWRETWVEPLSGFLARTGFTTGSVVVLPALGAEGRFLERDPSGSPGPLVALGSAVAAADPSPALGSLVRELCFPSVRRAFTAFEGRIRDRVDASRASDLAATRCGELVLESRLPLQVAAYRARFGLPAGGMGRAFLSAFGGIPGAAAWEGALEDALRRDLNLDMDAARASARPVRRHTP
jgi:hypothetical protein